MMRSFQARISKNATKNRLLRRFLRHEHVQGTGEMFTTYPAHSRLAAAAKYPPLKVALQ